MKRFLVVASLFLLPILICLVVAEIGFQNIPNRARYKAKWMNENASTVECLAFGSSHIYSAVRPEFLPYKAFNLAYTWQHLETDDFILTKYEAKLDSLKYLLIGVSYHSLFSEIDDRQIREHLVPYGYSHHIFDQYYLPIVNKSLWEQWFYFYCLGKKNVVNPCNELGWEMYETDSVNDFETLAKRHLKAQTIPFNATVYKKNVSYLGHMIAIAEKHNAKVLLLTTPMHEVYRKGIDSVQLQLTYAVCDSLTNCHSNVYWLNCFADTTFVDGDFHDAGHLNKMGAEHFSMRVTHVLDSLRTVGKR